MENQAQSVNLVNPDLSYLGQPAEAYLYFPPKEQQYVQKSKSKILRWYFDGHIKMIEEEEQKVKEFEQYLVEKKQDCCKNDHFWTPSMKLRFLEANNFKFDKTVSSIQDQNQWISTSLPPKMTDLTLQFLQSGICYLSGIDHRYRPIVVLNIYKIDMKLYTLEQIIDGVTYFIEIIVNHFFLPGQVENWVIIQDLNNMGFTSLPISTHKNIIVYLMDHYKSRLFRLYAVNCPTSVTFSWGVVKALLDETTIEKIQFEKTSEAKGLWTHANKNQVETKFGGLNPNIENSWPPIKINPNCKLESDKPEEYLISKDKYKEMYHTGQLKNNKFCQQLLQ
ncbi:hypothetical protein ABPG74_012686 [Tetrahymena malaccensis]